MQKRLQDCRWRLCNQKKTCPYSSFRSKICKNGLQKWNLRKKLGKEHLDCKKSTMVKIQPSKEKSTNDVSRWGGADVSRWRQLGLTSQGWRQRWCQQVTQWRVERVRRVDQRRRSLGQRVKACGQSDEADSFPMM